MPLAMSRLMYAATDDLYHKITHCVNVKLCLYVDK